MFLSRYELNRAVGAKSVETFPCMSIENGDFKQSPKYNSFTSQFKNHYYKNIRQALIDAHFSAVDPLWASTKLVMGSENDGTIGTYKSLNYYILCTLS